jgi:gluconate 5-dehydrogenase
VDRFAGRVVVVTGAGRGLGREICLAVAQEGAIAIPTGRQPLAAEIVAQEIRERGGTAEAYGLNVADPADVERTMAAILAAHGRVDILVNNAAVFGPIKWIADFPIDAWDDIFDVNARGAFLTSRAVLPSMVARGRGKIVNVGAGVLDRVDYACAAYAASKAALIVFTRMLAAEYRDAGIVAHIIDPGGLDTGMSAGIMAAEDLDRRVAAAQYVEPDRRLRRPKDVMPMILFALSDEADMMTGQFFRVSSRGNPLYLQL